MVFVASSFVFEDPEDGLLIVTETLISIVMFNKMLGFLNEDVNVRALEKLRVSQSVSPGSPTNQSISEVPIGEEKSTTREGLFDW